MSRRLFAKLVSQTSHRSRLDSIFRSSCESFSVSATCVAARQRAWAGHARDQCARRATTVLLGIAFRGPPLSRARRSSTLADLRNVSGLEGLNDELAEALVKDRAAARVHLYNAMMCDIHTGDQPSRGRSSNRSVERPVDISDLSHLSVRPVLHVLQQSCPPPPLPRRKVRHLCSVVSTGGTSEV